MTILFNLIDVWNPTLYKKSILQDLPTDVLWAIMVKFNILIIIISTLQCAVTPPPLYHCVYIKSFAVVNN